MMILICKILNHRSSKYKLYFFHYDKQTGFLEFKVQNMQGDFISKKVTSNSLNSCIAIATCSNFVMSQLLSMIQHCEE